MFLYNQALIEARSKQSELLAAARQQELAAIAQSGQKRFHFLMWLLSNLRRQPLTIQPKTHSKREVSRKPASNQGW